MFSLYKEKLFNVLKKKFNRSPSAPDYQWIVHHCRSTDRVFFGPFKNFTELDAFFDDPKNKGINCAVELLISPTCPKDQYWYNPSDYLRDNHPYLYTREPEVLAN